MILLLGDSNVRNTIEKYGQSLNVQVKDTVTFEYCTSVESMKAAIVNREEDPSLTLYGTPVNEIVTKIAKNQAVGRDEMVKRVTKDFVTMVGENARDHPNTLHLILPPFIRMEPKWAEEKIELMMYYLTKGVGNWKQLSNLAIGSQVNIAKEDLLGDKVHLNDQGKEKLYGILESDINKCKEDAREGGSSQTYSQDWASQVSDRSVSMTPATLRKRARPMDLDENESDSETKRRSRFDDLFDKMDTVLKEIREDRTGTSARIQHVETRVDEVDDKVSNIITKVNSLEKRNANDDDLTAEMRDDIDSLENENLKSVVIVRKLKAAGEVPTDKKLLRTFIQQVARELVQDVLGDAAVGEVRYATTLYAFIDPTKRDNQKGLIPPFKIGFKTKDMGAKFREEAVKKAKQKDSKLAATYFTHCQSSATRIRVTLLWSVVDALKPTNPEIWVSQNASRPTLQIKENGRVKTYTYVKAMAEFGDRIAKKAIDEATKTAKKFFAGQLKKTFIVLSD